MRFLMVLVFLLAGLGSAWGQRAQLLSFRDLPVPENGYLAGFSIDTWTVRVIAVCHLPPGWTITAGMSANFSGILSGYGSHGAAFLSRDQLHRLDNMLLVEVTEYAAQEKVLPGGGKRPASFDGRLDVGIYGSDVDLTTARIPPGSIVLRDADGCPARS